MEGLGQAAVGACDQQCERSLLVRPRIGSSGRGLRPMAGRSAGELLHRVGELGKCLEKATQPDRLRQRARVRRLLPARQNPVESPSQVLAERGEAALPDRVGLVHVASSSNERDEVAGAKHDDGRVIVVLVGGGAIQVNGRRELSAMKGGG